MVNPELYNKTNSLARDDAIKCLNEFASKLKWMESGETIIDLGCGDGSVTRILKKYVPDNYTKFVACDIRQKMIDFAKKCHADEDIMFRVQDIAGAIPDDMRCYFSHVFSFLMLHWVQDQEKAFHNIYSITKPGGECILTIAGYNPITYLYDVISQDKNMKWSTSWITDLSIFVTAQYVHMKNVEEYLREMMNNIGFTNVVVQLKQRQYKFKNIVDLKNLIKAVEPYKMPDEVFEEFFRDFISLGKEKHIFDESIIDMNDLNKEIKFDYEIFIVHASKPF